MASGESNLTTLQTLLCCNVTPTWLMTYYHLHPPCLPLFQLYHSLFPVLLPLCMLCFFLLHVHKTYSVGKSWGNMCREMYAKTIAYKRHIMTYNILRIRAAIKGLQKLCLQQSIRIYTQYKENIKKSNVLGEKC